MSGLNSHCYSYSPDVSVLVLKISTLQSGDEHASAASTDMAF